MRNFHTLDRVENDPESGVLSFGTHAEDDDHPRLAFKREGDYMLISASYGAMEIALRIKLTEFVSALAHLKPIDGLGSSRQIGTSQSYVSLGMQGSGALVIRPTIVADATGRLVMNLVLTDPMRTALVGWLA